eukprot:s1279_g5.t1
MKHRENDQNTIQFLQSHISALELKVRENSEKMTRPTHGQEFKSMEDKLAQALEKVQELEKDNAKRAEKEKELEQKLMNKDQPRSKKGPEHSDDVNDGDDSHDDSSSEEEDPARTFLKTADGTVPITHDALRMRTRRLCEKKNSGRCGVPDAIHNDYVEGGEKREILEMSLLQCLATYGLDRKWYKRGDFVRKVTVLKERLSSREQEDQKVKKADVQPLAPGHVSLPEEKPSPEVLGEKPVPELEKYMDSVVTKQSKIDTMVDAIKDKVPDSTKSKEC